MKTRLFLVLASLVLIGGCKKGGSTGSSASQFTNTVGGLARTPSDNTEPIDIDNVRVDQSDGTEPASVS